MFWLHHFLLRFKFYEYFLNWTKVLILPGFNSLPLYTIAVFFLKEVKKESLVNKASGLAYNLMLAIFPGIIFLFTLIPYIPIKHFQDKLLSVLATVMPTNAFIAFKGTIEDILNNQNGQLLSFGFLSAVYFATNGVITLMKAFNKSALATETRPYLRRRLVALVLTVMIISAFIGGISIMILGQKFISIIRHHLHGSGGIWIFLITVTRWVMVILLFFVTVSILYRYAPTHARRWKFLSAGSIMATALAVLTSLGFSYYINHFSSYNKVYGSIGTLIVTMIWLYLNSLIVLLGFELNASIDLSKQSIKIVQPSFNTLKPKKEVVKEAPKSGMNYRRE
ncbi:YihY/virulence factor BrkB family protein [Mucilaginibacter arboris]|uniref:YihY family inner membrane protein n=1 Tax=Mucilaginibacter arboris TaxID=2682090 RepID=A0A7K1T0L3_9SPHI|nr:YihY/virulence factor BrkB family protein [Mucilaginibacter arboris]MVN23099.1 YihY family inner membrane protein [Mucilaginibacter arboris]